MSTKKRRSNAVTKALLITALASGIAGMQAQPAFAVDNTTFSLAGNTSVCISNAEFGSSYLVYSEKGGYIPSYWYDRLSLSINNTGSSGYYLKHSSLYIVRASKYTSGEENSTEFNIQGIISLGDAKSILGGSSSSGLSEEQKTIIKDLIANGPGLFRLVENFFERNDDNDEYEKKT